MIVRNRNVKQNYVPFKCFHGAQFLNFPGEDVSSPGEDKPALSSPRGGQISFVLPTGRTNKLCPPHGEDN